MEDKSIVGKLVINVGDKPLELNILSGILDSSYTSFNFESNANENISGYNLTVDVNDLSKDSIRDLENVSNNLNELFRVILKLEGDEEQGKAKIAQNMGLSGITLNLELHN